MKRKIKIVLMFCAILCSFSTMEMKAFDDDFDDYYDDYYNGEPEVENIIFHENEITIYENTFGEFWDGTYHYDAYEIMKKMPGMTVEFSDGGSVTTDDPYKVDYSNIDYDFYYDLYEKDIPGRNKIHVECYDFETSLQVNILESEVEKVVFDKIPDIERYTKGKEGLLLTYNWYDDALTGEKGYLYNPYKFGPGFTMTMEDGTQIRVDNDGTSDIPQYEYQGEKYRVWYDLLGQGEENKAGDFLEYGTYKMRIYIDSGATGTIKYNIILEKPSIASVSNILNTGKNQIKWKKVEDATKYEIWCKEGANGKFKKLYTATGTTLKHTSAKAGKKYFYKVKAICKDSKYNSKFTAVKSKVCQLARPTITLKKSSSGKPKLTWKKVEGASKYEVWRKEGANGTFKKFYTTKGTKLTNSSAKKGKTYYYKVKAIYKNNANANSAFSVVKSIKSK